jgi:hypothetical protein
LLSGADELSSASTVIFFGSEACVILLSLAKEIKTRLEASGGYDRGVVRALLAVAYRDDTLWVDRSTGRHSVPTALFHSVKMRL